MCTVIYYAFVCDHYVAWCHSRCGGTKVKERCDSRRAACTAEGYITIKRSSPCNKCSRESWTSRWQRRLEKARQFHNELVKEKLPGASVVSELIMGLDKTFEIESWELRNTIPYGDRAKIRRVSPATVRRIKLPPSPLKREVQPEEIGLPVITEPVYDDDDDWVDPLHPIETNYEPVCAGIDDEYLDFLTGEASGEIAEPEQDDADPFALSWDWTDEGEESTDTFELHDSCVNGRRFAQLGRDVLTREAPDHSETSDKTELSPVLRPTAEDTVSSGDMFINGLRTQEDAQQEQIREVIKAFWDVVNSTDSHDQPPSPTNSTKNVSISSVTSDYASTPDPQQQCVDNPSATPSPVQSTQDHPQPNAPTRSNSTNTRHDDFRRAIPHPKPSVAYYAQWLVQCRMEIRERVGPKGARVPDPARPKA